jgi:exo-beta-1,3-glucanase (GH17 family)
MGSGTDEGGSGRVPASSRERAATLTRRSAPTAFTGALAAAALLVAGLGGAGAADAAETRPAASLRDPTVRILAPTRLDNGRVRECARVGWPKVPKVHAGGAKARHRATVRHHVLRRSGGGAQPRIIEARRLGHALSPAGATRRYCITHDRATSRQLRRSRLIHWEANQNVNSDADPFHEALGLTSKASHPSALGAVPCAMTQMDTITALTSCRNWTVFASPNGDDNASEATIKAQLQTLYDKGFRGISTYTVNGNMKNVPLWAEQIGFQRVLVGLWDPGKEIGTLKSIGASIDGVIVGNEGVLRNYCDPQSPEPKYTLADLKAWIQQVKSTFPNRSPSEFPVTTSDGWIMYLTPKQFKPGPPCTVPDDVGPGLMLLGDFLYPNLHAFWDTNLASKGLFSANPNLGAEFVRANVAKFFLDPGRNVKGLSVVLHESWWPSQLDAATNCGLQANLPPGPVPPPNGPQWKPYPGKPYTEAGQQQYFSELLTKQGVKFVWGEPFDIANKIECKVPPPAGYGGNAGPHWGLWHDTSTPKSVTNVIDYGPY